GSYPAMTRHDRIPSLHLLDGSEGDAKADETVPCLRLVQVSSRRSAFLGSSLPCAASRHSVVAFFRRFRISSPGQLLLVPVSAPFLDIAVHVVDPPGIRFFLADGLRMMWIGDSRGDCRRVFVEGV